MCKIILLIYLMVCSKLISSSYITDIPLTTSGCVQSHCNQEFYDSLKTKAKCNKCIDCINNRYSFCFTSDYEIYDVYGTILINDTWIWEKEVDYCYCDNFFPTSCNISRKIDFRIENYDEKNYDDEQELICYKPTGPKLLEPELAELQYVGLLNTYPVYSEYKNSSKWDGTEILRLIANFETYTNATLCPLDSKSNLGNDHDLYVCENSTNIEDISQTYEEMFEGFYKNLAKNGLYKGLKFSYCDRNVLWYQAFIRRPRQLDFTQPIDHMLVDGSFWTASNPITYEPNEFLCCNEEKEKLMDKLNHLRSQQTYPDINPLLARKIKEKWWQHHIKEKKCLSMQQIHIDESITEKITNFWGLVISKSAIPQIILLALVLLIIILLLSVICCCCISTYRENKDRKVEYEEIKYLAEDMILQESCHICLIEHESKI